MSRTRNFSGSPSCGSDVLMYGSGSTSVLSYVTLNLADSSLLKSSTDLTARFLPVALDIMSATKRDSMSIFITMDLSPSNMMVGGLSE